MLLYIESVGCENVLDPGTTIPALNHKGTTALEGKKEATCQVTKSGATGGEVEYVAPSAKKSSVTIPDTVTIDGVVYNVTSIAKNAFKEIKSKATIKVPKKKLKAYKKMLKKRGVSSKAKYKKA